MEQGCVTLDALMTNLTTGEPSHLAGDGEEKAKN